MKRASKVVAFLPIFIIFITLMLLYIFPLSDIYINIDYNLNKDKREKIVSMINGKEDMQLKQINADSFKLPINLRSASQNAKIIIQGDDKKFKILFYIHKGLVNSSAVIYVSDENGVKNGDFGLNYNKIKQIDSCWYSVIH